MVIYRSMQLSYMQLLFGSFCLISNESYEEEDLKSASAD